MGLNEQTSKEVGTFKEQGDEKVQDIRIHGNLGSEDLSQYDDGKKKKRKKKDEVGSTNMNVVTNIIIITPEVDQKGILKELSKSMKKSPGMDIIRKLFGG